MITSIPLLLSVLWVPILSWINFSSTFFFVWNILWISDHFTHWSLSTFIYKSFSFRRES
ncbi:hypothetical protein Mapa_018756 [Marchantia paleacea]|nr:hypothetical protein Mapa_018756 [Marchantia paleacea]